MKQALRTVWPYLWRYRGGLARGFGALVVKDLAAAALPVFIGRGVDAMTKGVLRLESVLWFSAALVGFSAIKGLFQYWMRVILIGTLLFAVSGVVMSALQANQHFFLPALAPIMYNLGILAGVIFLAPTLGVWGAAIGVVVGSLLHLFIQVPGLIKYRARWTARLGWRDPQLMAAFLNLTKSSLNQAATYIQEHCQDVNREDLLSLHLALQSRLHKEEAARVTLE